MRFNPTVGLIGALAFLTACVDPEAPPIGTVIFTAKPDALTASLVAHFEFESEATTEFLCSLDGETPAPCESPLDLTVEEGAHLFEVTANAEGLDSEPAIHEWTVDRTGPDTVIDSQPAAETDSQEARFTFHATEEGATFECRLDGAAFESCVSDKTYGGLSIGAHAFEVRSIDALGNADATPARFSWLIASLACELGDSRTERVASLPALTSNSCGVIPSEYGAQGILAVPASWFAGSAACGACYEVTGPNGTVTAVVAEQCVGCGPSNTWDSELDVTLVEQITGYADGIFTLSMRPVPCAPPTDIRVRMEGANPWYTKVRFSAHRHPIATASLVTSSTTIPLARTTDNGFTLTGVEVGPGPYKYQVTDSQGAQIEISGVPLIGNAAVHQTSSQFPSCD